MSFKLLVVAALLASVDNPAASRARPASTSHPTDVVLHATDTAWDAKDGRAMARLFTDDGSFRMPGMSVVKGRKALEAMFTDSFADRPAGLRHITRVQYSEQLGPGSAMTDADVSIEQRDAKGRWNAVKRFHGIYLFARAGGVWKLRSMRSFPVD